MGLFPVTGLPGSIMYPFVAVQLGYGAGPAAGSTSQLPAVIFVPMSSSGTWSANKAYRPESEQAVIDGSGAGWPGHRDYRAFKKINPGGDLTIVPYADTTDGSPAKADLDFTWVVASSITGSGIAWAQVAGEERVEVPVNTSSTATTIGAAMTAALNGRSYLPVTCTDTTGVNKLICKWNGTSGGDGTTAAIRVSVGCTPGIGLAVSTENGVTGEGESDGLGLGTAAPGVDGTTTETTHLTNALAAQTARFWYYRGISAWSATAVAAFNTHLAALALPATGNPCQGHVGVGSTLAAAQTLSTTQNYERIANICAPKGWQDPATTVGAIMGLRQLLEETNEKQSYDNHRLPPWFLGAPDSDDWPDNDDKQDAITDGVWLIGSDDLGAYIVMAANTRSKDASGTYDAFGALEPHRVNIGDGLGRDLVRRTNITFGNFTLLDDDTDGDGNKVRRDRLPQGCMTPLHFKPWVQSVVDERYENGRLQERAAQVAATKVVKAPDNNGRIEVMLPVRTCDIWHQTTFNIPEVTPN